jgi:tRNA-dihydrouridine synthase B
MKFLQKPFKFGKIVLPSNVFYSPLAGCSDYPFRKMSARYKPGLIYCEMVKMDAIVRNDQGTFHILDYSRDMHPIGAQIVGSKPEIAGQAARIVEELGFDVVDFNCGCPVDKVTKDGSGSGMLKNPEKIGEIISNMVAAVKIPVTVKIRAGWDNVSIVAPEITRIAEQAGATAIAIHARTRSQAYKGSANWDWIRECKEVAKNILVIGNGDLFSADAVERMYDQTGCDVALVSRGTMGAPWIVEDIYRHFEGETAVERSQMSAKDVLLEHLEEIELYDSPRKALVKLRQIGCWYLKRSAGTKEFRCAISHAESLGEAKRLIRDFQIDEGIGCESDGEMSTDDCLIG